MRNTKAIAMIVLMIASIGAGLSGVYWNDTTCPDGSNSDDNGNTCENNL